MSITLRAARVNQGLKQSEVAKLLGVSEQTISNWENGKSFPNVTQIAGIEKIYKMPYTSIIFLSKNHG